MKDWKDTTFLETPKWKTKKKREIKGMITFYLPFEIIEQIDKIAPNRSEFIRYCIGLGLDEQTKKTNQKGD